MAAGFYPTSSNAILGLWTLGCKLRQEGCAANIVALEYALTVSAEWVQLGWIPWSPGLESLLRPFAQDQPLPVMLEGLRPTPMPAKADFAERVLAIRSKSWFDTDGERTYAVGVEPGDPLRIIFRPAIKVATPSQDQFGPDLSTLVKELQTPDEHAGRTLDLRRMALKLASRPGFDTLLAPDIVRDVQLFDYQLKTVQRVLREMRGRALLCDEVGLGKTIEAAMILMEYVVRNMVKSALVLCPPSLVGQWQEELRYKFNRVFVTHEDDVFRKAEDPFAACPWLIASIDTLKLRQWKERAQSAHYDLIVVDEAHHLKNDRTLAYRLVSQLPKKFILLLTATPVENRLEELFNLITLLAPGHLDTRGGFRQRFISRRDPLTPRHPDELRTLLRGVMVRNKRSTTGAIVAKRTAHTIAVGLSPAEHHFYTRVSDFVRERYGAAVGSGHAKAGGLPHFTLKTLQKELGSSTRAVLSTLLHLAERDDLPATDRRVLEGLTTMAQEIPPSHKIRLLTDLLRHTGDEKVAVFTSYRATQDLITAELEHERIPLAMFHGQMTRAAKDDAIAQFAGSVPVLVSTESGGEGRNLQFCHHLVNFDLPWNPLRIEQRIGRIHRIGQLHDIHIYNLVAEDTVEAEILRLLDAKLNLFQLVVGELDMILGKRAGEGEFEDLIMNLFAQSPTHAEFRRKLDQLGDEYREAKMVYDKVKATDAELFERLAEDA